MKHFIHILALTLSLGIGHSAQADDYNPGMRNIDIKDSNSARPLDGIIWYPADPSARLKRQHRNGVGRRRGRKEGGTY